MSSVNYSQPLESQLENKFKATKAGTMRVARHHKNKPSQAQIKYDEDKTKLDRLYQKAIKEKDKDLMLKVQDQRLFNYLEHEMRNQYFPDSIIRKNVI